MSLRSYNAEKDPEALKIRLRKFKGGHIELRKGNEAWRGPIYSWWIQKNYLTLLLRWCVKRKLPSVGWTGNKTKHHHPRVKLQIKTFQQIGDPKKLVFVHSNGEGTLFQKNDPTYTQPSVF